MSRPRQPGLTENEIEVMKVLWKESPLKVSEILTLIARDPKPAYTSLMTLVQSMAKKGYVQATKNGKAYFYTPLIKQKRMISDELKRLSKHFFNGSQSDLVLNLVREKQLKPNEITELKKLLNEVE